MLLFCEPAFQAAVTAALEGQGLRRMDFRLEDGGARVLLNAGLRLPPLTGEAAAAAPEPPPTQPHRPSLPLPEDTGPLDRGQAGAHPRAAPDGKAP
jgi:hypothetical protein